MLDIMATFRDFPDIFIPSVALLHYGAVNNPPLPSSVVVNNDHRTGLRKSARLGNISMMSNNNYNHNTQYEYYFLQEFEKPQVISIIQSLYRLGSDMVEGLADNRAHSSYLLSSLSIAETFYSHLGPEIRLPEKFDKYNGGDIQNGDVLDDTFTYTPKKRNKKPLTNNQNKSNNYHQNGQNNNSLNIMDPEMLLLDSPFIKFPQKSDYSQHQLNKRQDQIEFFKKLKIRRQEQIQHLHTTHQVSHLRSWRNQQSRGVRYNHDDDNDNDNDDDDDSNKNKESVLPTEIGVIDDDFLSRQEQLDVYFRVLASLKQLMDVVNIRPA
jgi:hypothetical protein